MKIVSLVGARPQFVKEALINGAVRQAAAWDHVLIHSGQHYDVGMSDAFFTELGIPEPKYNLGVGSGTHATGTAAVLVKVEQALLQEKPDALIVYGDTNTTLAGALAAVKIGIPIIHIEAGIRQTPMSMPEEINRRLTDHSAMISEGLLCCCSQAAAENLRQEGIVKGVISSGDVMYDLFCRMRGRFAPADVIKDYGIAGGEYIVVTLHRDFNVDSKETLQSLLKGIRALAYDAKLKVLFPVHPRTRKRMAEFSLSRILSEEDMIDPVGYVDLMSLVSASAFVITDSGGLQKEAYYAGKRSIIVMPDTGWREITDAGWNLLADPTEESLLRAGKAIVTTVPYPKHLYGNGNAVADIVECILRRFQ